MNLAEQIKNEIRQRNGIDYDGLTNAVKEMFKKYPNAVVEIIRHPHDMFEYDAKYTYTIKIPTDWFLDVETWATGNGFNVKRKNNCYGDFCGFKVRLF